MSFGRDAEQCGTKAVVKAMESRKINMDSLRCSRQGGRTAGREAWKEVKNTECMEA